MATWRINPLGRNKAEVASPRARYVVGANATSFSVEAFTRERRTEAVRIRHVGEKYWMEGVDSAGRVDRRTMHFRGKRVISQGVVGGRRFSVASSVCTHIPMLLAKLRASRPLRLPLIRAFSKTLEADSRLRGQLQRQVDTAMLLRAPNSVVLACVIICAECFITGGELACALCSLCLKPDPST